MRIRKGNAGLHLTSGVHRSITEYFVGNPGE